MAKLPPVESTADTFEVRVIPKASANKIVVEEMVEGIQKLRIYVTAAPEDNKANQAVIKLLAKSLKKPASAFEIIKGEKSKNKTIKLIK